MSCSKLQLKQSIPLYSDLADLLIEYLEPCMDYASSKCQHGSPQCKCGHHYHFHEVFWNDMNGWEKILLENFCPFCGSPNTHKTPKPKGDENSGIYPVFLTRSTHLNCPNCYKNAESYDHRFCSACQTPLKTSVSISL